MRKLPLTDTFVLLTRVGKIMVMQQTDFSHSKSPQPWQMHYGSLDSDAEAASTSYKL